MSTFCYKLLLSNITMTFKMHIQTPHNLKLDMNCRTEEGVVRREEKDHLKNDTLSQAIVADMKVAFKPTEQNGENKNMSRSYLV